MRILVSLLLVIFTSVVAHAADTGREAVVAAKTRLDQAFQDRDRSTIEAMMTPDHVAVTTYYGGPYAIAQQLETLDQLDADFFDFSEPEVTFLGDGSAWVSFENSYRGSYAGKPLPARVFVSELWVKQDGTWLQKLYQETVIDPE